MPSCPITSQSNRQSTPFSSGSLSIRCSLAQVWRVSVCVRLLNCFLACCNAFLPHYISKQPPIHSILVRLSVYSLFSRSGVACERVCASTELFLGLLQCLPAPLHLKATANPLHSRPALCLFVVLSLRCGV